MKAERDAAGDDVELTVDANFWPGLAVTLHLAATLPYPVRIERVYLELEASPFGSMIDVEVDWMKLPDDPAWEWNRMPV